MIRSRASFLLNRVGLWQRTGQIRPESSSIRSKAAEAFLAHEISVLDKKALLEDMESEVKLAVAGLRLADICNQAIRIKKTATDTETIDALIYGVGELTDVISTSGDERLVIIQKLISDFLNNLKSQSQMSSQEQGDYEHADQEPEEKEPVLAD